MHLGPERDINVFEGLNVELAEPGKASIILATGFLHDDTAGQSGLLHVLGTGGQTHIPMAVSIRRI